MPDQRRRRAGRVPDHQGNRPVARIPEGLPFDRAVICEGAYYANASVEQLGYKPGDKVLIYGASGAIGTAALQLAKLRGADLTAVLAGRHLDLARSLGADAYRHVQTGEKAGVVVIDIVTGAVATPPAPRPAP